MARALPLYRMVHGESFEGTMLVDEALAPSEVAQRIKEAMEPSKDTAGSALEPVYPVPGHPPMRPEPGVLEFVSFFFPVLPLSFEFPTFFISTFGMAGPAEEANLQGLPSPIAEGPCRGDGESHRG